MKTTGIRKNCEMCDKEFLAPISEHKRGNARFCSLKCANSRTKLRFGNRVKLKCDQCSAEFERLSSRVKVVKHKWHFCSRKCKDEAQRIGGVGFSPPHYKGNNYRDRAIAKYSAKCQRCGYDDHLAAIVVHHKDCDRNNNSLENLEVLCSNCHAVEHWGKTST